MRDSDKPSMIIALTTCDIVKVGVVYLAPCFDLYLGEKTGNDLC